MDRRSFLLGAISAGAAAIAAQFKVSEAMGAEIIDELKKDLGRTVVAMPKTEFLGHDTTVWTSKADIKAYYLERLSAALGREPDAGMRATVNRMQLCIDQDFKDMKKAGIPPGKVILEAPQVRKLDARGLRYELIAGSKPGKSILGTDIITVGYIAGADEIIRDYKGDRRRSQLVGVDGGAL